MMDEKKFEQEYKKLKRQAAPDLWDRIEGSLKEHPEREQEKEKAEQVVHLAERKRRPIYGMAAAAAILVLVSVQPVMKQRMQTMDVEMTAASGGMAAAAAEVAESAAAAGDPAEAEGVGAAAAGDQAAAETVADAGKPQVQSGAEAQVGPGAAPDTAAKGQAENGLVSGARLPEQRASGPGQMGPAAQAPSDSIVQAQRAAVEPLTAASTAYRLEVPADALTVSEDARYFSESILGDTELLCGATVVSAWLEQDESGREVKVAYQMTVEHVEYAEDYIAPMDTVTVKSPIISTEGDEAYVLYQLMPGNTYLLPLVQKEDCFELLYPFAPQIQVTEEEGYVFHSGYASLISPETSVTAKEQEGANDYYYDRMLIRTDDNFLSDLIALIKREAQGRK